MDKIKVIFDTLLTGNIPPTKEKMRAIINEIVYADILKEQDETLAKATERKAKRIILNNFINQLKWMMSIAEAVGLHHNTSYKNPEFKGNRILTDSICLTWQELEKMNAADLSSLEAGGSISRDIFMVGVYTAQRVSDYNNIHKEYIRTTEKRWIEDIPYPENLGKTKAVIRTKEITYIDIDQKKTGAKVSIPCKKELIAILEKYDYNFPQFEEQTINRHIKEIARVADITDSVTIQTSRGGVRKKETVQRYNIVRSHTVLRTGTTMMHLAGVELFDIMKVTGYTTIDMFKRYIKADQLDVVYKLTDKYNYFD